MAESQTDRTTRILKTVLYVTNYDKINEFSDAIGANYMQVYNAYAGRTKVMPQSLAKKILEAFPELNPEFVNKGEGEPLLGGGSHVSDDSSIFIRKNDDEPKDVTTSDMFKLLDRVTDLMKKVQEKWEELDKRELVLENRLRRIDDLESRLIELLDKQK